jgi:hypothetical protein
MAGREGSGTASGRHSLSTCSNSPCATCTRQEASSHTAGSVPEARALAASTAAPSTSPSSSSAMASAARAFGLSGSACTKVLQVDHRRPVPAVVHRLLGACIQGLALGRARREQRRGGERDTAGTRC